MPKLQRVPEANVEYAYGIYLLGTKHRLIKALKKRYQPSIHGHRTWGAGFLLMDYLSHNPLRKSSAAMEIGCGWGQVSIYCARQFKSKMTAVDLDDAVFPFLDVMADLNAVQVTTLQSDFNKLKGAQLKDQRYLIGSDICFWDSMIDPLSRLVNRAIKAGVERVIITDPGRPTFYEFCDRMAQRHDTTLQEWYAIEPERFEGEVVEIRPRKDTSKGKTKANTKAKSKPAAVSGDGKKTATGAS